MCVAEVWSRAQLQGSRGAVNWSSTLRVLWRLRRAGPALPRFHWRFRSAGLELPHFRWRLRRSSRSSRSSPPQLPCHCLCLLEAQENYFNTTSLHLHWGLWRVRPAVARLCWGLWRVCPAFASLHWGLCKVQPAIRSTTYGCHAIRSSTTCG